jgi:hypothetical protein
MTGQDRLATNQAVHGAMFSALTRTGIDVATAGTWDAELVRDKRVLVPIDVQAYVVGENGDERIVPVGYLVDDPDPFVDGDVLPTGVHLHWAMPDALLRGRNSTSGAALALPDLPDRWVVIRTVLPEGQRVALATGWVIDAVYGVTRPLAGFTGTFDTQGLTPMRPLNGASGGTLLWTATYSGAQGRFTLHDPLLDLAALAAPNGLHGGRAVYTVAGWWSDPAQDPLANAGPVASLTARLAGLGWGLTANGADELLEDDDPQVVKSMKRAGLSSPEPNAVTIVTQDHVAVSTEAHVAPKVRMPVDQVHQVIVGMSGPHYHSLLHGSVLGVPIDGSAHGSDDRPDSATVTAAIGQDVDDVVSAFAAPGFGLDAAHRQSAERLMGAFASGLIARLSSPDGLCDLEEREHANGFWPLPGKPVPGAQLDRLRAEDTTPLGPTQVGRKGRADAARRTARDGKGSMQFEAKVSWRNGATQLKSHPDEESKAAKEHRDREERPPKANGQNAPATRSVERPAPRMFRPAPALVGLRNVHVNLRHHGDGLFDDKGLLRVRFPGEVTESLEGTLDGAAILPTLGNGAVPPEMLKVVREAILLDGYSWRWLAQAGSRAGVKDSMVMSRVRAEMVRLYGTTATYDASGGIAAVQSVQMHAKAASTDPWSNISSAGTQSALQVGAELSRFSLFKGTPPSPVALTTWRQPWVPLSLEWRLRLDGDDTLTGWSLGDIDFEPGEPPTSISRVLVGRSVITASVGARLTAAIGQWLKDEQQRDLATPPASQLSDQQEAALGRLAELIRPLDVVSASLDGVCEQLLGIDFVGMVRRVMDDGTMKPEAIGLPVPLFGGTLTVERLRLLDAFGRVLELPVESLLTTSQLELADNASGILMRPRLQTGARLLARFVDPGYALDANPLDAPEAYVDQTHPPEAITPISGFLLPDHIDEALEIFDRDGNPLGQVMHDSITNAVTWEVAPGRPLPPDAGPLADIPDQAQHAALLAAGLIRADVNARHGIDPPVASSLSALLRAIDSTLWTVDTYSAIGSPTIAGLVGRPIAVVRLNVTLDVPDDIDDLAIREAGGPEARRAALAAVDTQQFPFRVGEIARSDDSVLGFYVDDDYSTFHVVDRVVASGALSSDRYTGFLGLLGQEPEPDPIDHPFLAAEDTLMIRPGQTIRLTVLMLPAGRLHLTTGIVPRKALQLADDWVTPGLAKVMPSMRVGPVLVDPAEIRLPNVSSLGSKQVFTRRTGPLTWRDDPILASTTSALLPKMPHETQEGWIRIAPTTGKQT